MIHGRQARSCPVVPSGTIASRRRFSWLVGQASAWPHEEAFPACSHGLTPAMLDRTMAGK